MYLTSLGLVAGILAGLFGIGGGIIIVPALILLFHLPYQQATGTSLGALLFPFGILGALEYHSKGNLNIQYALLIALGLFIGTFIGAKIANVADAILMKRIFGGFIIIVGLKLLLNK